MNEELDDLVARWTEDRRALARARQALDEAKECADASPAPAELLAEVRGLVDDVLRLEDEVKEARDRIILLLSKRAERRAAWRFGRDDPDARGVATEALIKGVDAYDPDRPNANIRVYPFRRVDGALLDLAVTRAGLKPHVRRKVVKVRKELTRETGADPTVREIAERVGLAEGLVSQYLRFGRGNVSIRPSSGDDAGYEPADPDAVDLDEAHDAAARAEGLLSSRFVDIGPDAPAPEGDDFELV